MREVGNELLRGAAVRPVRRRPRVRAVLVRSTVVLSVLVHRVVVRAERVGVPGAAGAPLAPQGRSLFALRDGARPILLELFKI